MTRLELRIVSGILLAVTVGFSLFHRVDIFSYMLGAAIWAALSAKEVS